MVESDIAGLLSRGFESKSAEDTLALASAYAKTLKPDAFIALSGDLGAGKTAFAKGIETAICCKRGEWLSEETQTLLWTGV